MNDASTDGPIILFDGVCNLCHAAVTFVIRRDPEARFRFAPLDSEAGRRLIGDAQAFGRPANSLVLLEQGECFERSEAVLQIVGRLSFPWPALVLFRIVPRPIRDSAYDFVARNRQRWFGRRAFCPAPKSEWLDRFLD